MKIGVKVYRYEKGIEKVVENSDFIEIMALDKEDYSFFKHIKIPKKVHSQHQLFGVNNADSEKYRLNVTALKTAVGLADYLNADRIIVHPGAIINGSCSFDNAVKIFRKFRDKRIVVENMPTDNSLCNNPLNTQIFMEETGCGLCFDINHVIESTFSTGGDYRVLTKKFIDLNPSHYHLGGQKINGKSHLCLEESEINPSEMFNLFPDYAWVTLETSNNLIKTKEDLVIARNIISPSYS